MLLSEAVQALCIATRANGRAQRTVESYRKKIGRLIDFLGDVDVEEVTVHDLRRWVAHLMDSELSLFTTASRVRHVRRLWNFLVEEGEIDDSPMAQIRTPSPKRRKPKSVRLEDVQALLRDTQSGKLIDLRDRALILTLMDTGMRVGALCNLKVEDLDIESGLCTIVEKGEKTRNAFFTETTAEALATWLKAAEIEAGPVFVSLGTRGNGSLTPSGVLQMLRRRGERVGAEGPVNCHSFRHALARSFLLSGGDLATLSQLLGHEDIAVTRDYYAIFTRGELKRQHDKHSPVRALFGGNGHD